MPRFLAPIHKALVALQTPAVFLMRVISGITLVMHGLPKIQSPMSSIGMVVSIGFYPGFFWSPALAVTEFFAGILLTLGLLTRLAALGAFIILIVASYFHYFTLDQGWSGAELALIWSTIALYFLTHGGGRISADQLLARR